MANGKVLSVSLVLSPETGEIAERVRDALGKPTKIDAVRFGLKVADALLSLPEELAMEIKVQTAKGQRTFKLEEIS